MSAEPGDPAAELLAQVARARDMLRAEREAFLSGTYDRIGELNDRKLELLAYLEGAVRAVPRRADILGALTALIADSRRNEMIIRAVREGLAQARRQIAAVRDARRGVVAYAKDGTKISCRADHIDRDKTA